MEGVGSDEVEDMDFCKEGGDSDREMQRDRDKNVVRDKERDLRRDKERDLVRDKERDKERDFTRDKERDELRDRLRDIARDEVRDLGLIERGDISVVAVGTPPPVLTVEKVMEVFKRIKSVSTPDINNKLAIPCKKPPVKDSSLFKQEYAEVKESLRKISGGLGKVSYQAEKERKTSAPFTWPASHTSPPTRTGGGGGDPSSEVPTMPIQAPVTSVAACYEVEIAKVTARIQALSNELVEREKKICTLEQKLAEKERSLRSYAKVNLDLKRRLQEAGTDAGVGGDEDDPSDDEIERRVASQGPKQKKFSDLGNYQKRVVSQQVVDTLRNVSDDRQIDPKQMTGYVLKR